MEPAVRLFVCALICICVTQPVWGQDINYNTTWYNQLGSKMTLNLGNSTGLLTGEYFTAVTLEDGTAAPGVPLIGIASRGLYNSTFGFVAAWLDGAYIVTWSGEYKVCGDEHVLFTSWVLKPVTDNCRSSPLSTRIGQDCFTQFPQIPAEGEECEERTNPCNTQC